MDGHSATAYTARWVLPVATPPIEDGVVIVVGTRIVRVGRAVDLADEMAGMRVVAMGNAAIIPGLVNAHSHLELTAMRGFLEGLDFRDWLSVLTAARRECLDETALLDSARHGLVEALLNGISTCADTAKSVQPLRAMHEMGVRGIGYIEVFGPDPSGCADALRGLQETTNAERTNDTALVRAGISPHAPYTVSASLFRAVAQWAQADDLPLAVHVAESGAEVEFVRHGAGPFADRLRARGIAVSPSARSPIALLESTGILDVRPLLIHAIQVDDTDLASIAASGASIVHCPISNAKLAQGIAPLDRMLAAGIPTGLGSDSVASNDRMDILGEARQASLFHALRTGVPDALTAHDALALATMGGARALGLDARIGTLEAGKDADLAAFPLDHPSASPLQDPAVALVHILAGAVLASLVTVAGRELVRDGRLVHPDHELPARVDAIGRRLHEWRKTFAPDHSQPLVTRS